MVISFVIITWNSEKYIRNCIKSYQISVENAGLTPEFIIIDNGSTDNTLRILNEEIFTNLKEKCKAIVVKLKKNYGTTITRNIGLRNAVGELVVICDSDTEYMYGDWHKTIKYFIENKDVGILSPLIVYEDGSFQNSIKKFPTAIDKMAKLAKIFFNINTGKTDFYKEINLNKTKEVDTATSAFWLLKKDVVNEVGFLDEKIFYSPEDIDYCLRVWKKGRKVIFYPWIKILHCGQQISHKKPFSKQSLSHFFGLIYYFKKHRYIFSIKRLKKGFLQKK